jgi:hypothetical protein
MEGQCFFEVLGHQFSVGSKESQKTFVGPAHICLPLPTSL